VVAEFGFCDNEEEMLGMIRAAPALYPACPEVRRIPHYQKFNRSANGNLKPGDTIPNVALAHLNGTPISLYDYIDTSCPELSDKTGKIRKPLVIAAGSYTWLPFCSYVADMHHLYKKFIRHCHFLTIYIVEAHAVDEWPVGDPLKISQPLCTTERIGVARAFVREYDYQVPMVVDTIKNEFSEQFAAWPIRFYVVEDGRRLVYKAQPDHNNTYDSVPRKLEDFLEKYTKMI